MLCRDHIPRLLVGCFIPFHSPSVTFFLNAACFTGMDFSHLLHEAFKSRRLCSITERMTIPLFILLYPFSFSLSKIYLILKVKLKFHYLQSQNLLCLPLFLEWTLFANGLLLVWIFMSLKLLYHLNLIPCVLVSFWLTWLDTTSEIT